MPRRRTRICLATVSCTLVIFGAPGLGSASAKTVNCGSVAFHGAIGGPGVVSGEKFFHRVKVAKGDLSCPKARSVIDAATNEPGKSPAGFRCTLKRMVKCVATSGKRVEVDGTFYGVKPTN